MGAGSFSSGEGGWDAASNARTRAATAPVCEDLHAADGACAVSNDAFFEEVTEGADDFGSDSTVGQDAACANLEVLRGGSCALSCFRSSALQREEVVDLTDSERRCVEDEVWDMTNVGEHGGGVETDDVVEFRDSDS
ncbi:hypothetical protein EW026_g8283 [Hermanssonia centrifuga]|uniref:Uncharacterized protein n=1 Tax=Hermanssonia centrifuga TaxID=98765 RepID=A0A4S4K4V1_9APHY|nr:hypothetical protein EW026_g8283 [Hermanssonia centrifuga]